MKNKKTACVLYCVLFFLTILIPLAGMTVYQNRSVKEKRILTAFPKVTTDDSWNREYLSQLGEWFEDHFAFRSELVQANSMAEGALFGVSGEASVICGKDGYLFYKDSLEDYLGNPTMDARERYGTRHYLELILEYTKNQGADFVFSVAPNKNTLYPEFMPYYYRKISESGELARLSEDLKKSGVPYADLREAFEGRDEVLYHKLDSHWNNEGAALAMETIMDALEREHTAYGMMSGEARRDFDGDLYGMLYPLGTKKDENIYYDKAFDFDYGEGFHSTEDMRISTQNQKKRGNAVVFRDSFGNSLTPFLAEEFGSTLVCRDTPYPVEEVEKEKADVLIFEIVERHLNILAREAPVMPAPIREFDEWGQEEAAAGQTMQAETVGKYLKVTGKIPGSCMDTDSEIYVRCISGEDTKVFEAFPLNGIEGEKTDYGYGLYIPMEDMKKGTYIMELLTRRGGTWIRSGYLHTQLFGT